MWPFEKRAHDPASSSRDVKVQEIHDRTTRLEQVVDALGVETRAVAREAIEIREKNHFGAALIASMSRKNGI